VPPLRATGLTKSRAVNRELDRAGARARSRRQCIDRRREAHRLPNTDGLVEEVSVVVVPAWLTMLVKGELVLSLPLKRNSRYRPRSTNASLTPALNWCS